MSGKATAWVLKHGPRDRAMRAVLTVIASSATVTGEHARPGNAAIVEASLYSRARVYDALRRLLDEGWLEVEQQGDGRGNATVYRIVGMAGTAPQTVQPSDAFEGETVQSETTNRPVPTPKPSTFEEETVQSGESSLYISTVENDGKRTTKNASMLPAVVAESDHLAEAQRLCQQLADRLAARGENVAGKASSKAWLVPMDALLRIDGRDPGQVGLVIDWLDAGKDKVSQFWRPNVRSPVKLREHWCRMAEQYQGTRQGAAKASAIHTPNEPSLAEVLSMTDRGRPIDVRSAG